MKKSGQSCLANSFSFPLGPTVTGFVTVRTPPCSVFIASKNSVRVELPAGKRAAFQLNPVGKQAMGRLRAWPPAEIKKG
jgi:hypothetical protein